MASGCDRRGSGETSEGCMDCSSDGGRQLGQSGRDSHEGGLDFLQDRDEISSCSRWSRPVFRASQRLDSRGRRRRRPALEDVGVTKVRPSSKQTPLGGLSRRSSRWSRWWRSSAPLLLTIRAGRLPQGRCPMDPNNSCLTAIEDVVTTDRTLSAATSATPPAHSDTASTVGASCAPSGYRPISAVELYVIMNRIAKPETPAEKEAAERARAAEQQAPPRGERRLPARNLQPPTNTQPEPSAAGLLPPHPPTRAENGQAAPAAQTPVAKQCQPSTAPAPPAPAAASAISDDLQTLLQTLNRIMTQLPSLVSAAATALQAIAQPPSHG
ncbi:uncharacterized protein LOC124749038 [Schistocerca piceifrons]|uniref:uncharacterized protein LOC124749038 n=1 Tax=Schistocerca piceifrons TaxID=274613 RepID=UPI001F5F1A40|nr:uncharacterized protein LOC124749038 [Schistocerca piceifrons]